ncbi:MAG: FkbM family methyltransferase [Helicobacter sp.]|nr:FkbM family methyltransferase [Helicobacter sp.]
MNAINRPLPFILAATNTGMMILNYLDKHQTTQGAYGVGYQYLQTASFDPQEVANALTILQIRRQYFGDGVVALDCGANIGAHTIAWAIEMTHYGEVIAFEAQERIYYALAGNIALNNCFNAKAIFAALGNPRDFKNGGGDIEIPQVDYTLPASFGSLELKADKNNEFIGQHIDYTNTQKVPLKSIDSLNLARIDFMKIDVERMEVEVLKGARKMLKKHKPILSIEIIKSDSQEILDFLTPLGYEVFPMEMNILCIHKKDPTLKHIQTN